MYEIDLSSPERQALLEKRVRRKLDIYVLLPLTLLLGIDFVDKPNLAYASIAGLIKDLNLQGTQFNNVIAVNFVTFTLSAMPSTTLLKKFGPNRLIGFLAGGWGIAIILVGLLVKNYPGMIAARLVLGVLDGGLIPAMVFYMSLLYRRDELQSRIALCYAGGSGAGLFGGLFAGAIVTLDGRNNLSGWRWIFIIEGIIIVVIAIVITAILPTNTATAWFFTKAEREYASWRLEQDIVTVTQRTLSTQETIQEKRDFKDAGSSSNVDIDAEEFEWREIIRGVFDIQTWLTGVSLFLNMAIVYSAVFFMPTILVGLGYSGVQAQLQTVLVYLLSVVLIIVVALLGDRLKLRGPFVLAALPLSMLGYIMMIATTSNTIRHAGACLVLAGSFSTVPPLMAIMANNSQGHYKRASAMALQSTIANISGIPGTYIYTLDQQPRFVKGHSICLALMVVSWILIAANVSYCIWENKARREGRRSGNIEKYQALRDAGKTKAPIGDRHPDFIFVL